MRVRKFSLLMSGFVLLAGSQLVWAQDEARLVSMNPRAGRTSIYQLSFTSVDTLSPTTKIEIVLPSPFDISQVRLTGSSSVNGGFNVHTRSDTIIIERSGLGRSVPPGEQVELKVATVRNPKDIAAGYVATVAIFPRAGSSQRRLFTLEVSLPSADRAE